MKKKPNLRFLMALGGQKIIILQDDESLHVYSDKAAQRKNVSVDRVCDVIGSK